VAKKKIVHGTRNTYERHGCRCDECRAVNAARSQSYRDANPEEMRAADRAKYHRHKDRISAKKRANYDPEKTRAQNQAKYAIRKGVLVRGPCEVGIDCRGAIQAHHDDYSKPLDVRWLCRRHHAMHHVALGR